VVDLAQYVSPFTLRARVVPALLVALPALLAAALLLPYEPLLVAAQVAVAAGVLLALAAFVRRAGKRLEVRLAAKWGELPAQQSLSLLEPDHPERTKARRELVEQLLGRPLPSRAQERSHPERSARERDLAVRDLIPRVRGEERDPLLHDENVQYNFKRNLRAVRPAGLLVAVLSAAAGVAAALLTEKATRGWATAGLSVVVLLGWLAVTEALVREAANVYSDRYYDALARLRQDLNQS
jgi:hypothetical protein